jgi:hypothetical protein
MFVEDKDLKQIIKDIESDFHTFLQARSDKKDNSRYYSQKAIHCSQLDTCTRQVVMDFYGFPKKDLTTAELILFEIANFVHRLMADWARQSDVFELIGNEYDLSAGLPDMVTGKSDIVTRHKGLDKNILFDTKTAMPNAFKKYYDYLVKESHRLQGGAYKRALANLGTLIDFVIFGYYDRGGTNKPVYVAMDGVEDFELDEVFERYLTAISEYDTTKVLPPKEPIIFEIKQNKTSKSLLAKKSWQCSYCKFCDVSCEGYEYLEKDFRVVGKLDKDGNLILKEGLPNEVAEQYKQQNNEGLGIL